jgi:hypothetical protein
MRFAVVIDGIEVRCESEHDAMRLARLAGQKEKPEKEAVFDIPRRRGRPPTNGKSRRTARKESSASTTLEFLRAVQSAGAGGVAIAKLVAMFGLPHGRAVGGVMVAVKNTLRKSGFEPLQVFARRGKPGNRRWVPAARLADAIGAIEAQGGAK